MSDYNDFLGQVQMRLIEMGYLPPLWPTEEDPVESAAQMIAGLMDGWISVEDRLPESYRSIELFRPEEGAGEDQIWRGYYNPTHECFYSSEYEKAIDGISYWMPLPEPPKDERED